MKFHNSQKIFRVIFWIFFDWEMSVILCAFDLWTSISQADRSWFLCHPNLIPSFRDSVFLFLNPRWKILKINLRKLKSIRNWYWSIRLNFCFSKFKNRKFQMFQMFSCQQITVIYQKVILEFLEVSNRSERIIHVYKNLINFQKRKEIFENGKYNSVIN